MIGVKLEDTANVVVRNYYGRKVRTVLADLMEYLELRKTDKPKEMTDVEEAIANMKTELLAVGDDNSNAKCLQSKLQKLEQQLQSYNLFRAF